MFKLIRILSLSGQDETEADSKMETNISGSKFSMMLVAVAVEKEGKGEEGVVSTCVI